MGKYRHKVTGKVGEYSDSYAAAVSALEPVSEDTPTSPVDCGPCGGGASVIPAGVEDNEAVEVGGYDPSYADNLDFEEPAFDNEEK